MPIISTSKKLRERSPFDFYPTHPAVAEAGIRTLLPKDFKPVNVLDPGAGDGIFGKAVRRVYPEAVPDGIDIRTPLPHPDGYANWWTGCDYLMDNPSVDYANKIGGYDLIVGNPPYGKLGEAFIRRAMRQLADGGIVLFLFRSSFLGSEGRMLGLYTEFPLTCIGPISPRPSFLGEGKKGTDADEYAYFRFDKPASPYKTYVENVYWGKKEHKRDTRQLSFL